MENNLLSTNGPEADWEITPEGLYMATRSFLLRRGYCCANRCRNCPYINWQTSAAWQHAPASTIRRTRVSPKTLAGARAALETHRQALATSLPDDRSYHLEMIEHYERLLANWW
jgi:hypothetical protein